MGYRCTSVRKLRGRDRFVIDGKEMLLDCLSRLIGIGSPTIRRRLKGLKRKERIRYVNDMLFRHDHGIPVFDNVYFIDGIEFSDNYMTAKRLASIVDSKVGQARTKLAKWAKGKIDCDELFRPAREINTGELSEDVLLELEGMQPRRNIEDLDYLNPTKWDKKVVNGSVGEPVVFGVINKDNRRY